MSMSVPLWEHIEVGVALKKGIRLVCWLTHLEGRDREK